MSLAPGTRLGTYEVLSAVGAGGMGEVYRARDTKLGREVAIKILPDRFTADAERVARFEREARTLAALNHPNIAHIYDSGIQQIGGQTTVFLAMEFVDGDDLAATIDRGRVPLPEALKIAHQVASALETAHEQGIIHRDLKPANIKIRPDGMVKVLDFGLAKALIADSSGSSPSITNSPTMTSKGTELGLILGTAAYMSPEQARGKVVDRRADVWAFGVVLYELLTGKRAFGGAEVSDVLASVLKDTLPLDALPADTPPAIRRLLRRCLQKDRAERLDSMGAARLEIAEALAPDSSAADAAATPVSARQARRIDFWKVAAALAIVAAAAGWWVAATVPSPSAANGRVLRFDIPVEGFLSGVSVTPSGDTFLLETDRIYLRGLADTTLRPIPGTEGARNMAMSPDGRWVLFQSGGKLKKVAIAGGDPLNLADCDYDTPGSGWGPDNTVLFSSGWVSPLVSVSADGGGKPTAVSTVDTSNGEMAHWWPQLLPDRKSILFTIWMTASGINDARIGVLDLSTGKHRAIGPGAFARYTASGHLVYFHAGSYHAMKFDAVGLRPSGDPVKVLADVVPHDPNGTRTKPWAASDEGTLMSIAGPLLPRVELAWVAPTGVTSAINLPAQQFRHSDLTADGRWFAASGVDAGVYTIWITDLLRQTQQKIALPGSNFGPFWKPDGQFFTFTSLQKGHFDVWRYRLDEGRAVQVLGDPFDQNVVGVSKDGTTFVVEDTATDGTIRVTYGRYDQPQTRTTIEGQVPPERIEFSSDDKWLAVDAFAEGRRHVTVRPFAATGPVVNITPKGGNRPFWAPKGSTIFYQRDQEIVAVRYSVSGGRFIVEGENVVVRLPHQFMLLGVAPDGRFLVGNVIPGQDWEGRVVLNWFNELPK